MSAITIYDVAREAGVSPSTVSNLLNGRTERMQPTTRARVEAAILRLNYSPSRAARQLRSGGIHTIGLIVPSVSNPFWGSFATHFEGSALRRGFGVLLCNSGRDAARERAYLEELLNDGISNVVLGSSLPSVKHLRPLIKRGLRVVMLDRSGQEGDPTGLFGVSVDNASGARAIAEHFWEAGHRRFAFISGELDSVSRRERLTGFTEALTRHGVDSDDIVIRRGRERAGDIDVSLADVGRQAAYEILSSSGRRVTAIATVNDLCAIGVYRGIRDAGLEVGRDVAVAGFDDIPLAQIIQPTLTTVHQPLDRMSEIALTRLLGIPGPEDGEGVPTTIEAQMVVRESSMSFEPAVAISGGATR